MISRLAPRTPARDGGRRAPFATKPPAQPSAMREWLQPVEQFISDYPLASLGMALSVGVFLGWLVKRR
jgi:ElaB/YqjD/DUF883 family membrane-anchored ribosome-binding protein